MKKPVQPRIDGVDEGQPGRQVVIVLEPNGSMISRAVESARVAVRRRATDAPLFAERPFHRTAGRPR